MMPDMQLSKQEAEAMVRHGLQQLRAIADKYGLDFAALSSDAPGKQGVPLPSQPSPMMGGMGGLPRPPSPPGQES